MTPVLSGIVLYIVLQLVVGFAVSLRVRSEEDYLLAGRRLGPMLGILTVFATWFGAESCVGAAGAIYAEGIAGATADPFGYAACLFVMGTVFAIPLWRRGLTTVGDLFRQRYSPGVERFFALFAIPTSVLWASAQIRAFGQVLAASSDLPVERAIAVAAAVTIVYTVSGGLLADAVTDFIQGIVLLLGLVVIAFLLHDHTGGLPVALAQIEPERWAVHEANAGILARVEAWAIPICGSVLAQELVARILAIRTPQLARRVAVAASALYVVIGTIPVAIGLLGPALLPNLAVPEQLLPRLAATLLPGGWYVIFAGALVSAILSTVDSALLAAASLCSHNLLLSVRPTMNEAMKVRAARTCVVLFGLLAFVMATYADSVYALVEEASAFGSAGIFVVGTLALFTDVGGPRAATAGLVSGLASYVYGSYFAGWETPYLVSLAVSATAYALAALSESDRWKAPVADSFEVPPENDPSRPAR